MDYERRHEQEIQRIRGQRAAVEQEKSEVAFDLKMWQESSDELDNRIDELVHQERTKKNRLLDKVQEAQVKIQRL